MLICFEELKAPAQKAKLSAQCTPVMVTNSSLYLCDSRPYSSSPMVILINSLPFIKSLSLDYLSTSSLFNYRLLPPSCACFFCFIVQLDIKALFFSGAGTPKAAVQCLLPLLSPSIPIFFPLSCGQTLTLLLAVAALQP